MNPNDILASIVFGGDGGGGKQITKVEELSTDGGASDAGKVLVVGDNGKIAASDLTVGEGEVAIDKGLVVNGAAADAKVVGDAIASLNGSLANKVDANDTYTKSEVADLLLGKASKAVATQSTNGLMSAADKKALEDIKEEGLSIEESFIAEKISDWLDDHPEATTTVSDGAVTEAKLSEGLKNRVLSINVLHVEDVFDCSNTGVDATADTELIKQILAYAKSKKYSYVLFPEDSHWLLMPNKANTADRNLSEIYIPTRTTVDLNGGTWEVAPTNEVTYDLITFDYDSEYSKICNGTIIGDRYTNPSSNSNCSTLYIGGKHNVVENITIKNTSGDGFGFSGHSNKTFTLNGSLLDHYSYVTGEAIESEKSISLVELLTISDYSSGDGLFFWLGSGSLLSAQDTLYQKGAEFITYFYDESETLIKTNVGIYDTIVRRAEIPTDAKYVRFEIKSDKALNFNNRSANWILIDYSTCDYCTIKDCRIENVGRNGITIGSSYGARVENCVITNVIGRSPQVGIDIEPSRAKAVNVSIENVSIHKCGEAAVYISTSTYFVSFKNCFFGSRFTSANACFLTVDKCIMKNTASFASAASVDWYTPVPIVRQCRFFANIFGCAEIFDSKFLVDGTLALSAEASPIKLHRCHIKVKGVQFYNQLVEDCTIESIDTESISVYMCYTRLINCTIKNLKYFEISAQNNGKIMQKCLELKGNHIEQSGGFGIIRSVGSSTFTYDTIRITDNKFRSNNNFVGSLTNTLQCENGFYFTGNDFKNPITLAIDHVNGRIKTSNETDVIIGLNRNASVTVS